MALPFMEGRDPEVLGMLVETIPKVTGIYQQTDLSMFQHLIVRYLESWDATARTPLHG
jgi:hypothetical protein